MSRKNKSIETETSGWAKALDQPALEFPLTSLPIISGIVPPGLKGSLYRNGPARLSRNGQRVGHWFDGDGDILAVHFNSSVLGGQEPKAIYRYVQTREYQIETEKGRYIFGCYGTKPLGNFWDKMTKPVKNPANTSVLALPDRLLALWEGGHPYGINLRTLETLGIEDLGGLENHQSYSAHPKRDSITGDIYNFGVTPAEVGKTSRFTYLSVHRPEVDISKEMFGAIARFDHQTNTLTTANLPSNCYPMEPIYAPNTEDPQKGWILTVVFNSQSV